MYVHIQLILKQQQIQLICAGAGSYLGWLQPLLQLSIYGSGSGPGFNLSPILVPAPQHYLKQRLLFYHCFTIYCLLSFFNRLQFTMVNGKRQSIVNGKKSFLPWLTTTPPPRTRSTSPITTIFLFGKIQNSEYVCCIPCHIYVCNLR